MPRPTPGILIYCEEDVREYRVNFKAVHDGEIWIESAMPRGTNASVSMGAISKIAYRVGLPMELHRTKGDSRYFQQGRNDNAANLAAECKLSSDGFGIPPRHFGRCDDSNTGTVIAMPHRGWHIELEHVEALCKFANEFVSSVYDFPPPQSPHEDERLRAQWCEAKDLQKERYAKAVLTPEAFKAFWEMFRGRKASQAPSTKKMLEILNWELPEGFPL